MNWLDHALEQAQLAYDAGEVPVGAVVIKDAQVIGAGYNRKESLSDPTAHAEVQAIRSATEALGDWRLNGCELYCTLEPCPMCLGAILQTRLDKIVYGAKDLRWGACGTIIDFSQQPEFNHHVLTVYQEDERCSVLLKQFFKTRR